MSFTVGYRTSRAIGWLHSLGHGLLLLFGFLAVFAITGYLLWREGILREALRWTILDHAAVPPGTGLRLLLKRAPDAVGFFALSALPLLLGAGRSLVAGVRGRGRWEDHQAEFFALLLLLGVSVIGVSINGQFLYHYFLQLLPPLALLAAPSLPLHGAGNPRAASGSRPARGYRVGWRCPGWSS